METSNGGQGAVGAQGEVPRPTPRSMRIEAIDLLRGLVLVGILLMNMPYFGLPHWAEFNPTVAGGHEGADWWAWFLSRVLVDGKARALFSMLFGAGVILMTRRMEASGPEGAARAADIYYRRILWLIAFGLVDAYLLLWPGDILYAYALQGLLLFPLRKLRARTLIIAGLVLVFLMSGFGAAQIGSRVELREAAAAAKADKEAGKELTKEQEEKLKAWEKRLENFEPPAEKLEEEVKAARGGYGSVIGSRGGVVKKFHSMPIYFDADSLCMMLIGMGLVHAGVLTGERSRRFYAWMAVLCVPTGWAIASIGPLGWSRAGFSAEYIPPLWKSFALWYPIQRLLLALGYMAVVMLVARSGVMASLQRAIAAAGSMPLTNYIGQTIICNLIFTGVGFAMFNKMARHELLVLAVVIWAVQVIFSVWWLGGHSFGPLEWVWRWLSYREKPAWGRAE